jgi:hypothetical protein
LGNKPVSFWEAFWFWVKLGFINFGARPGRSPSCTGSWWSASGGSPMDEESKTGTGWLILIYRIPREPSRPRVAAWRELKTLGALYL